MNGKLDQILGAESAALAMRARRQQAIASNIANADTPGYQAIDVDFSRSLRDALGEPAQLKKVALETTALGHQLSTSAFAGVSTVRRASAQQVAADGNGVDMDQERARFADNAVRYEAALRFLNGKIKTLLSAIQGS
jgi:flagellar basal-body rod protein FlgB